MKNYLLLFTMCLPAFSPAYTSDTIQVRDIIINEVMFNHPEGGAEYVELYNRSSYRIDCSGLVFTTRKTDGTLNTGVKIPPNTIMPPNSYLALTTDAEAVRNFHDCPNEAVLLTVKLSTLNNESACLVLTNANKNVIYDEFQYHADMHHVLIKNPKGVALERIYPNRDTQDKDNWHSAAASHHYGTPGFQNSQYREELIPDLGSAQYFYLENEIFTPDNDGNDDLCALHYTFPERGYVFTVHVLSATGVKVFTPAEQYLAGTEGILTWDGRNQQGNISDIGIYVFYIEVIHPQKGKRKILRLPVVLSSR
ncbi:MAG: lamin tail domain-containing protein [Paludibacter sp.]|jgi:hypothetical protein|nr:lamin tail domain-containing protein [Bacteroidales bacterium]HOS46474.1 lamin tail domain-containing protein [Paludibacter sp.]